MEKVCILLVLITHVYEKARFKKRKGYVPTIETVNTSNYNVKRITVYNSLKPTTCTYCLHAQGRNTFLSAEYNRAFCVISTTINYCFPKNHQYIYGCTKDVRYRRVPSKQAKQTAPNSRENTQLNNENGFISTVLQLWPKQREN